MYFTAFRCMYFFFREKSKMLDYVNLTLQYQGLPVLRTGHTSWKCSWSSGLGVESSGHEGAGTNSLIDSLIPRV